jgi:hypothetical protein
MIEVQADESARKIDRIDADRQGLDDVQPRRSPSNISYRVFGQDFSVEPDLT